MASAKRGKRSEAQNGAWHTTDAVWGEMQRVRLVTGSVSLIENEGHVRSVHAVGFVGEGECVLLVQNRDQTWTFPGGRLEGGETIGDALIREVWEEAGATIAPGYIPVAATRIEFLNRLPDRVYRVHPSFLLWVVGEIASMQEEPCHDPAPGGVVGRRVVSQEEAYRLLGPLEQRVLDVAITTWRAMTSMRSPSIAPTPLRIPGG